MNKLFLECSNSNYSQSNETENIFPFFQSNNEGTTENQMQKNHSQNETHLSTKGNVKSYCRIRPNNTLYSSIDNFKVENNSKTLVVDFTPEQDKKTPSKQSKFKYDFTEIFWTQTKNKEIYEKVCKQSIEELFTESKNALIFVYGITNSGKTYTVIGDSKKKGILQLSLEDLINKFKKLKEYNNSWKLTCTYIEIYNEEVYDLLSIEKKKKKKVKIGGMGNKFYPQGCIIKNIESEEDFKNALTIGEENKTIAETNANSYSSRSHSIFRVELSYEDDQMVKPVSLCIVDLAGAERLSKSGVLGSGIKEAGNINSSLMVLKKCFEAMEANSRPNCADKKVIVPVRESKLTMLFKEYFGDNQNISVICTINPDKNEMLDNKSVLNFGAKAMRVKPIKSMVTVSISNYSSSKEISLEKSKSRDASPIKKEARGYRLLTDKKYIKQNHNNNCQKNVSKEKNSKCSEDYYLNNLSSNKKQNIKVNSMKKFQNIKLIKNSKYEHYYANSSTKKIKNFYNENSSNDSSFNNNDENYINNVNDINYEQRIKCTTNPFEITTTNNLFIKNGPSKEKLELEIQKKEEKQKEIREKMDVAIDLLIKKIYYNNKERNIEAYENQCNNIDLKEAETLLSKNNSFSLKNPFIKNYKEDSKMPDMRNALEKNNDLDVTRTNYNLLDELQIKLTNSNDHDKTKIQEYLDRSLQEYEASKFKAYFGIGESLIKKDTDNQNTKKEDLADKNYVGKFNALNNDIEMADNFLQNCDINFNDSFSHEFNFKGKGKINNILENNDKLNNNKEKEGNKNEEKVIKENDNNVEDNDNNLNVADTEEEVPIYNKTCDNNKKKKKKKSKKKKKENQSEEEEKKEKEQNEDEDEKKEETDNDEKIYPKKYRKSKKDKKKGSKKNVKSDDSNDDISDDESSLLANKKNNKNKKKKNKKKKIESDNDNSDDNSFNDDYINIKPMKSKKGKSKKRKNNN